MLHHMATILVCYGGHFEPKMAAKIQNPPIWAKFGFQVDYEVLLSKAATHYGGYSYKVS
jgi:hypothetical protein